VKKSFHESRFASPVIFYLIVAEMAIGKPLFSVQGDSDKASEGGPFDILAGLEFRFGL
jgi:hypothetical protein